RRFPPARHAALRLPPATAWAPAARPGRGPSSRELSFPCASRERRSGGPPSVHPDRLHAPSAGRTGRTDAPPPVLAAGPHRQGVSDRAHSEPGKSLGVPERDIRRRNVLSEVRSVKHKIWTL